MEKHGDFTRIVAQSINADCAAAAGLAGQKTVLPPAQTFFNLANAGRVLGSCKHQLAKCDQTRLRSRGISRNHFGECFVSTVHFWIPAKNCLSILCK
jgi:hypothetical protein